ncbi:CCA tRNA nucleotidyltransferase [Parasphingorhabdus cellanae]|uniref:CCA tRNA nucleotidyltransferase n=1 Tax=Parasphingorhabdus cellanae TaxID=2806553 RepID=A0ABX7TA78_9SPHN|nr:CCA tRNA nucleotidyltransferase [Parasphingorhabdus cellanae]QTD57539.1 CCA tRNA nucleotidyltransferase [Parasphingorhabdus cellanae]
MTLPPQKMPHASWHQRQSLKDLITVLDGHKGATRFVGGAVRDTVLGLPVKDIDAATMLKPDAVMARLKQAGIKAVPTGIEHGTVTAVTDDGPVEITTLRRDVSTDGRRATVAFSDNWKEDAARRDFTINALFADPETLEISDYFGGLADLEKRHIRFIGSAEQRIAEDHLRIMRYFRFLARFGQHAIDQATFDACRNASRELSKLSRERVADELMKLLGAADPVYAVQEMIQADVFANIVSEIDANAGEILAMLILREEAHNIPPDPIRRLVGLLPKDANKAIEIVTSLRFSKKMRRAVANRLTASKPHVPNIPAIAYQYGKDAAQDIALLFAADDQLGTGLAKLDDWVKPVFPITGGDLIAIGLEPGPIVAKSLEAVEAAWIAEGFPGENRVRTLARQIIENA